MPIMNRVVGSDCCRTKGDSYRRKVMRHNNMCQVRTKHALRDKRRTQYGNGQWCKTPVTERGGTRQRCKRCSTRYASVNGAVLQYVMLTTTGQENRVVCCAGGNKGVTVPEKYLPQAAARTSGAEEAKLYVHTKKTVYWKGWMTVCDSVLLHHQEAQRLQKQSTRDAADK